MRGARYTSGTRRPRPRPSRLPPGSRKSACGRRSRAPAKRPGRRPGRRTTFATARISLWHRQGETRALIGTRWPAIALGDGRHVHARPPGHAVCQGDVPSTHDPRIYADSMPRRTVEWAVKDSNSPGNRTFRARMGAPVGARHGRNRSRLTHLGGLEHAAERPRERRSPAGRKASRLAWPRGGPRDGVPIRTRQSRLSST